jgi:hypothetical protein
MSRNGLDLGVSAASDSMLGVDAIHPAAPTHLIAPARPPRLRISAAFTRNRKLHRRIKSAAHTQSPRLG